MEEAELQQLGEEGLLADRHEFVDLVRVALGQLFSLHPLRDQQVTRAVF